MLVKLTLNQGVESATSPSGQELAMDRMEEPRIWIERHTGKSRKGLSDSWSFLVLDSMERLTLARPPAKKEGYLVSSQLL